MKYNPVVLICSHRRQEITRVNIKSLLEQSVKPNVVLVLSDWSEADLFRALFPEITVEVVANEPLGRKWQMGVNAARRLSPNPLIITGSDDILGFDYIKNGLKLLDVGYHFVGLRKWICYEPKTKNGYVFEYKAPNFPLGGGRMYTDDLLIKMRYSLFDVKANKHLDDMGWNGAKHARHIIINEIEKFGLYITAVKGEWPMLNPLAKHFTSRTVKHISTWNTKQLENILPKELL